MSHMEKFTEIDSVSAIPLKMNESNVLQNKKDLESILAQPSDLKSSSESCMKLLNVLVKGSITMQLLSSTKIGVVVNNIKKAYSTVDESISKAAANVVAQWKKVAAESRKENKLQQVGERSSKRPRTEVSYNEDAIAEAAEKSKGSVYSNGQKEVTRKLKTKVGTYLYLSSLSALLLLSLG